ncbi:uncharacterized protein ATNIH1004_008005 [Aspergillus tanneri]|uniref:Major facilitator superfamily (MFS) profile domain-containing protein n=1 Tax=Aspergillus tanneri TaxID=1220188 RepID=A0A5M9MHV8_9EURO|nr:uncharacterized protein ATNIH1004_008005 [Aspergillus tanneri]KAA8646572.1 hypothetical protein ATNIH1004_008005 [Aspergillus tanneri]
MSRTMRGPSLELANANHEGQTRISRTVLTEEHIPYLKGYWVFFAGFGLGLALFLTSAEITIVSTALATISNDLSGSKQSSWVINAYLLSYTGIMSPIPIHALPANQKPRLSRYVGQIIVCRAFQGVGGSGVFSLTLYGLLRIVPPEKYDAVSAAGSTIIALGLILGPLMGGALTVSRAWRWIFLFNLPCGALSWGILCIVIPRYFPYGHREDNSASCTSFRRTLRELAIQSDPLGMLLLLAASLLLVAALLEGNVAYEWSSALIISFFTVSGVLWIFLALWEWYLGLQQGAWPMLPWRTLNSRAWMGVLLGFFLTGPAITIVYIEIPQRFQTVYGKSPLEAGVMLLAYAIASPLGGILASICTGRWHIAFVYLLLLGAILQTVGSFLLSAIPTSTAIYPGQFGYMAIAGLGSGLSMASLYMLTPLVVRKEDQAVAIGASLQIRMLGAALGIAVVNSVLTSYVKAHIPYVGFPFSTQSIEGLPLEAQRQVRTIYAAGYNLQMKTVGAFSATQVLSAALLWKREQIRFIK